MKQTKTIDLDLLKSWVGREASVVDSLEIGAVRRVAAFFDRPTDIDVGDPLEETWHWCFFHPALGHDALGHDGHPRTGGFLPPLDLPRRMWGGSKLEFHAPLRAGRNAEKISRVLAVDVKQGRTGTLGLVKIEHRISQEGVLCRAEEQDIVYREAAKPSDNPASAPECPDGAEYNGQVHPDPVMLFRYSALTYNSHRIHYDRAYAKSEEGYEDLVVHGPLTASLLARFARESRGNTPLSRFAFRGTSPLFVGAPFDLSARNQNACLQLWATRPVGGMAMSATAVF